MSNITTRIIKDAELLNDLNDLVRAIMLDAIENYTECTRPLDELCGSDGAFTTWTTEILDLVQIKVLENNQ